MGAALLLCSFCAAPAFAADIDTATVVKNIQDIYGGVNSFRARFTQELSGGGVDTVQKGSFVFRKPMLVRWETEEPSPELLVVTSQEIWRYLADEKFAYRYNLDSMQDSRPIIAVITGQSALDKEFEILPMQEEGDPEGMIHLLLYPYKPVHQMVEAHIWVDEKSFLIRQAMVMDFFGNSNKIAFENMVPGAQVKDSDFNFVAPSGVVVEDHFDDELSLY